MDASERTEVSKKADQVKEHRRDERLETVLKGVCSNEQIPPGKLVQPYVRDRNEFEIFAGGAGV